MARCWGPGTRAPTPSPGPLLPTTLAARLEYRRRHTEGDRQRRSRFAVTAQAEVKRLDNRKYLVVGTVGT